MEQIEQLRQRKELFQKTMKALVFEGHATDTSLAITLGVYRRKIAEMKEKNCKIKSEDVEKYLKLLKVY